MSNIYCALLGPENTVCVCPLGQDSLSALDITTVLRLMHRQHTLNSNFSQLLTCR